MKTTLLAAAVAFTTLSQPCQSQSYSISPDGSTVTRYVPTGTVSASSLPTALLPAGWTASAGNNGTISTRSYSADYVQDYGGAKFEALYSHNGALPVGYSTEWIQVVSTNVPYGTTSSVYLNNGHSPISPFYRFASDNQDPSLPPGYLRFYDFPKRPPQPNLADVSWNASLYPVLYSGTSIIVQNGISWGFTTKKAMVGSISGNVGGRSNYSWGGGNDDSWLSYSPASSFDTSAGALFKLGTLTFHNGVIPGTFSQHNSTTLTQGVHFNNVPELDISKAFTLNINNTFNNSSPSASADTASIAGYNYTFHVNEGGTASVALLGALNTNLALGPVSTQRSMSLPDGANTDNAYALSFAGFRNVIGDGFITSAVPEPSTWAMMIVGFGMTGGAMRRRRRSATCFA